MRILVVQESDWLERGPHQSHQLMERMSLLGHEIRVIDFEIDWRKKESQRILTKREVLENTQKVAAESRVTVVRPQMLRIPILAYLFLPISHGKEIKRQVREFKPDIIVGFSIVNSYLASRIAKANGIPFVYYIIDELHKLLPEKRLQGIAKLIERRNLRKSTLVLAINEGLREYAVEMGADAERTRVLRAGIDLQRFSPDADGAPVREKLGIDSNDIVLFYMGWLYEFSGLRQVTEEMALCPEASRKVKLLIMGKGDLWTFLNSLKEDKSIGDRIICLNWQPYSEVPKYLAAADICILPAENNEIMRRIVPIKVYEYLAAGKPVISTRLPGIMKEFGNGHGVHYVSKPAHVLDRAIQLRNDQSFPSEKKKARSFVENNDWDKTTKSFERLLEGIV